MPVGGAKVGKRLSTPFRVRRDETPEAEDTTSFFFVLERGTVRD